MKTLIPFSLIALLGAGCSMNDQTTIQPMDNLREDWNDNVEMSTKAQQAAYAANQGFVSSGIVFHDYVQKDMGLSPGGVWYPTYDMAEGKVPLEGPAPECAKAVSECAKPEPAKAQEEMVCPVTGQKASSKPMHAPKPAPEPAKANEQIDYDMLNRSIKTQ
ncbi:hypothetical protein [Cerasicoccus frondis]|uniref:hypothetical protein n=1 Tax=Cerasicoccus frondis TaxID=490090 RepID=UPI002852D329|nr:hypothetical protein [Cerasicoccus frondis]